MTSLEASTSRRIKAGGVDLHYHDSGSGFPVVLLHGGGPGASGWSNFGRNVAPLAQHWRVLVPDLPGFGKSQRVTLEERAFGFYSGVMRDFLQELDIPQAHFVGNSLGGGTALKLALDHPANVGRLVLMGTGGSLPVFSATPTEGVRRLFDFYAGTGPSMQKLRSFIDLLVYDASAITDELLAARYAAATLPEVIANPPLKFKGRPPLEDLWREELGVLKHDVLLVNGREDRVVPLDSAFLLLKLIPNARLHVLPKCGHWAQWEHADEFNALVHGFLSRVAGNAAR
jgi:2-hydroxy-6-oxonona-2,4-dienedioate hydrolase/4,5:9,10-diseco-3-hydroxy-5,9,17-trioxoandrosta-1(10),2-diene-4-oate hydrolase